MCKILTVLNKKPENRAIIQRFIDLQVDTLTDEPHGYSVFSSNANDTKFYLGQNAYKKAYANLRYDGSDCYMIHFRTSTGGELTADGLHLQNFDGRVWAHNGMAPLIKHTDKSDSYYFFKELFKKRLSTKNIKKAIDSSSFWGKAFIYNIHDRTLSVFMNCDIYITAIADDCIIITSYKPILDAEEVTTLYGVEFSTTNRVIRPMGTRTYNNCMLVFNDKGLQSYRHIEPRKIVNSFNYGYNYNQRKLIDDGVSDDGFRF